MFTGIVEELGTLLERTTGDAAGSVRLTFASSVVTEGTSIGDSIAVNGCCLTVVDQGAGWWSSQAVEETMRLTNLGGLTSGQSVNLERPVRLSDRLGGHLVQGHVDAVGTVGAPAPGLRVDASPEILRYLVEKGSVTVDGVSLTVVEVTDRGFSVALIPHTTAVTTLGSKVVGDQVNLEVDVIAKYTERLLRAGTESPYADLVGVSDPGPEGR